MPKNGFRISGFFVHYSPPLGNLSILFSTLFSLIISGCSTASKLPASSDTRSQPHSSSSTSAARHDELGPGLASWYGQRFHHRRTASGERFNMYDLTAAHRTLPFGTKVRVTSLSTGRSVVVRIIDRGPQTQKRLIDVSYQAGKVLGILRMGIARVEVSLLKHI